jgi:uncharacterized protein
VAESEPISDSAEPIEADGEIIDTPPAIECWRCGRVYDLTVAMCPYCRAKNRWNPASAPTSHDASQSLQSIHRMLAFYIAMLITSVLQAMMIAASDGTPDSPSIWILMIADAILVLCAWKFCRPRVAIMPLRPVPYAIVPILGIAALMLCLILNFLYTFTVNAWIDDNAEILSTETVTLENILLTCVFPGIVEELFFRGVAFGVLRHVLRVPATIFLTSAMFSLAHLYNPLGMPYLFLCGVILGWSRTWGGGLLLPMIVHGLHNYVVAFIGLSR